MDGNWGESKEIGKQQVAFGKMGVISQSYRGRRSTVTRVREEKRAMAGARTERVAVRGKEQRDG